MPAPPTKPGTRKLSEVARHVVVPSGIVTTGYPAVQQKCKALGIVHDDWQQGLGRLILGKRKDGIYAATVGGIVLSLPRQLGKTFTVGSIIFALCLLFPGLTVVWTAHHTRTSDETFGSLSGLAKRSKVRPHVRAIRAANGQQAILFHNGSRIMFGARDQGFGRGFTEVDIVVYDEGQILKEKALDDMVAATNQSRHPAGALLFFMGTPPTPTDPSEAFSGRRTKALTNKTKDAGAGFGDMVYVEMSADQDSDPDDRKQWVVANPSVPDRTPMISMERLRENLASDEAFLREGLGVWAAESKRHVIDPKTWSLRGDALSMPVDRFSIGIDVSPDRSMASVSFAGQREDGSWHVELDEARSGVGWLVPYLGGLLQANPQIRAVVVDGASQAASLADELTDRKIRVTMTDAKQMAAACGQYYTGITEGWLWHTSQPQLTLSLSMARKRLMLNGKAWGWVPKNAASDITPIVSSTLALWGAMNSTVQKPTRHRSGTRRAVVM